MARPGSTFPHSRGAPSPPSSRLGAPHEPTKEFVLHSTTTTTSPAPYDPAELATTVAHLTDTNLAALLGIRTPANLHQARTLLGTEATR